MNPSNTAQAWAPTPLPTAAPGLNLSHVLVRGLQDLGVSHAFGLVGGAIAPFSEALDQSRIRVIHCRHESGAGFAALEHSLQTGRPAVVFVTTGPGITNALTGLTAARWEGGRVILVSATTSPTQRGRGAFQETSPYTTPYAGLYEPGNLFHEAVEIQDAHELPSVLMRLRSGFSQPGGFLAHVGLPIRNQKVMVQPTAVPRVSFLPTGATLETLQDVAELIREDCVVWVGHGARHAATEVRALVDRLQCPVMCSPRAKGIVSELHPRFLGVTGFGGHANVKTYLTASRPAHILVLGSRLGEFTSGWDPVLTPRSSFIQVDVNPRAPGCAYPEVPVMVVQDDVGRFVARLLEHLPRMPARFVAIPPLGPTPTLAPRGHGPVRPQVLLEAIQRVFIDALGSTVMTEAGNAFAWGTHLFRFREPAYRVSVGFGSMGHATAGILGVALAQNRKAVALVGDGAMLMNNEVSTAVHHGVPAVWIVLNDSIYGMIQQGMTGLGLKPVQTGMPLTDFAVLARAVGAEGIRVETEGELDAALLSASTTQRPCVVDVVVDPGEKAPFLARVQNLLQQSDASRREG